MKKTDPAWSGRKEVAARLIAEGELTQGQIAKKLSLGHNTLTRWRRQREFRDKVAENLANISQLVTAVANQTYIKRAELRSQLLDRISQIIHALGTEELLAIKRNPIAAINLMLRMQNAEELFERRRQILDADYEEEEFPRLSKLPTESIEQIIQTIEQDREEEDPGDREPRARLR